MPGNKALPKAFAAVAFSFAVSYAAGQDASGTLSYGDIVISEVMANPSNVAGLPEAEYIELYNATASAIDLSGWTLRYGSTNYTIESGEIAPLSYIVLTRYGLEDEWDAAGVLQRIDMTRFPTISNTGNTLYIFDDSGNVLAYTHYTDERYGDAFKSEGGFSIERIDVSNINDTPLNWAASCDESGGTPGRENSVSGLCEEKERASFVYASILSPDTFALHFTVPLDWVSVADDDWCEVLEGGNAVVSAYSDISEPACAYIVFESELGSDDVVDLLIDGLLQIDGEFVVAPETVTLTLPRDASDGGLVFNEVLFNASTGQSEFVELANVTSFCIEADGLSLVTVDEDGSPLRSCRLSTESRLIVPNSYVAFTSDTATICSLWSCEPWNAFECSLPVLNNDGGKLALYDAGAATLDLVIFSPDYYPSTAQSSRGISWEKINPALASNNPNNWLPATAECGYATPGRANSQEVDLSDPANDIAFELERNYFTPNGDGNNDSAIIKYSMSEGGWTLNMSVFDSNGREVARPMTRETLAESGNLFWHGTDDDGNVQRRGIYVIMIEAYNQSGGMVKKKLAVAIN